MTPWRWAASLASLASTYSVRLLGLEAAAARMQRLHREAALMLSHRPGLPFHVSLAPSAVAAGSGQGVFLRGASVKQGQALCLYPGLEIPALPHAAMPMEGSLDSCMVMRAHPKESHYVLNLNTGGTMDAMTIKQQSSAYQGAAAGGTLWAAGGSGAENPFAIGHMVNHCSNAQPNVVVACFQWKHALPLPTSVECGTGAWAEPGSEQGGSAGVEGSGNMTTEPGSSQLQLLQGPRFHIPNEHVQGFWFLCPSSAESVQLPARPSTEAESVSRGVSGVALVACCDIEVGSELLLDYNLRGPPWPDWAQSWYQPAA